MWTDIEVGDRVRVVEVGEGPNMDAFVGKTGEVTNLHHDNEWIGVRFDDATSSDYIAGDSWNEFYDFQLKKIEALPLIDELAICLRSSFNDFGKCNLRKFAFLKLTEETPVLDVDLVFFMEARPAYAEQIKKLVESGDMKVVLNEPVVMYQMTEEFAARLISRESNG